MSIEKFIPLEALTTAGTFTGDYYPIKVDEWNTPIVDRDNPVSIEQWLLVGERASGPIIAEYSESEDSVISLARKSYVDAQLQVVHDVLNSFVPLEGGQLEHPIFLSNCCDGLPDSAAVTVGWVKALADQYLKVEGGEPGCLDGGQRMLGPLTLWSTLDTDYNSRDAIPRFYLEERIERTVSDVFEENKELYIKKSGDSLTGHVSSPDPRDDCDAATLGYLQRILEEKSLAFYNAGS